MSGLVPTIRYISTPTASRYGSLQTLDAGWTMTVNVHCKNDVRFSKLFHLKLIAEVPLRFLENTLASASDEKVVHRK